MLTCFLLLLPPPRRCHGNGGGRSQITGSGFLPGRAPGRPLQTHAPFTGSHSGLARRDFFLLPVLVPPISWLLLSESRPSLCLGVQSSGGIPASTVPRLRPAPLLPACRPGQRVGSRSLWALPADLPGPQGGGPYRDAPRHVPHAQREPTEAAHDEGVGAPCPSLRPPHPEFPGVECARLTDPLLCFCPQSQGHEE